MVFLATVGDFVGTVPIPVGYSFETETIAAYTVVTDRSSSKAMIAIV